MRKLIKVLYLVNIPSPYRVSFFNELGKLCDLTVLFERKTSTERETSWLDYNFNHFKGVFLCGIKSGANQALCVEVLSYLSNKKYDHIVVGGYSTPTGALAITWLKIRNIPFILNVDGGMIGMNEHKIKYEIKKHFISSASAWLSTGKVSSAYLEHYGARKRDVFVYPFSSVSQNDLLKGVVGNDEKRKLRSALGMKGARTVISVGRFIQGKGFDVLLKACAYVDKSVSFYIIGGQPTQELLELKKTLFLDNVYFLNHKPKEELLNYYRTADLFVLPTRKDIWGLVVNEALANGLPVITTDKCVAGLELVTDYQNGFIVPVDDIRALATRINEVIGNEKLLMAMSSNSLNKAADYTIEKMATETLRILMTREKGRYGE